MGVEGAMKCIKCVVFFFNFLFLICGLALVFVGVVVQVSLHSSFEIKDPSASGAPIALIVIGVVVFFIAFFGCCGAWKESYCMVTMFAVLLVLIIVAEIAAAIAGYIFRNKVQAVVHESLSHMILDYSNSTKKFQESMDQLQKNLKCCGLNSSSDWKGFSPDGNTVPDSCCVNVSTNCGKGAMTDPKKVHMEGCNKALKNFLDKNIFWVIVAALVIAAVQVLGVAFACVLMRGLKGGYEVM